MWESYAVWIFLFSLSCFTRKMVPKLHRAGYIQAAWTKKNKKTLSLIVLKRHRGVLWSVLCVDAQMVSQ